MPNKKKSYGSARAKAGLPAKAGKRKRPGGGHQTSPEQRNFARWLRTHIGLSRESMRRVINVSNSEA